MSDLRTQFMAWRTNYTEMDSNRILDATYLMDLMLGRIEELEQAVLDMTYNSDPLGFRVRLGLVEKQDG